MKQSIHWLIFIFILFTPICGLSESYSHAPSCFSCRIDVKSLDDPIKLSGMWKFTRNDNPRNADPNYSIKDWPIINTPGRWSGVYEDGKLFKVGWYRGNLHFSEHLIGEQVTILIDVYMSPIQFFLDGKEIYSRSGKNAYQKYYSIQPIPIHFTVTKKQHTIAFRVNTILMTGVYQLPFRLVKYKKNDFLVSFSQFWGGEFRFLASFIVLVYGSFFLLVYVKTRASIYLAASLSGIAIYPFYGCPSDMFIRFFDPEVLQLLHYTGIGSMAAFHSFYAQFFYKFYPRINRINLIINLFLIGIFVGLIFYFDLMLYQIARKFLFIYALIVAQHYIFILFRAAKNSRKARILFVGECVMWICSVHDTLIATGYIQSVSLLFFGTLVATISILFVSSSIFANTYVENKLLISKIGEVNRNLEGIVTQRTSELKEKSQDVMTMLESLPQGVLMITEGLRIHKEYSRFLIEILETENIADNNAIDLIFVHSSLKQDQINQVHHSIECCLGNWSLNFDANAGLLPAEIEFFGDQGVKILSLVWSPVTNSEDMVDKVLLCIRDITDVKVLEESAAKQQREMDIIAQLLAINEEKFWRFYNTTNHYIDESIKCIENNVDIEETFKFLFRHMHTIKGNSRTLNFSYITELAHQVENDLETQFRNQEGIFSSTFYDKLNDLAETLQEYGEVAKEKLKMHQSTHHHVDHPVADEVLNILDIDDQCSLQEVRTRIEAAKKSIEKAFRFSIEETLFDIVNSLSSISKELGKPQPLVKLEGAEINIPPKISDLLVDIMGHLLKNALDHGIESPQVRQAQGKEPAGKILLRFWLENHCLHFTIQDDGRGLNLVKIREKCIEKSLPQQHATNPSTLAHAIFESGFSTKEKVTQISGRGVGLDAVKRFFDQHHGEIMLQLLDSVDDSSTAFYYYGWLPLSSENLTRKASSQ